MTVDGVLEMQPQQQQQRRRRLAVGGFVGYAAAVAAAVGAPDCHRRDGVDNDADSYCLVRTLCWQIVRCVLCMVYVVV